MPIEIKELHIKINVSEGSSGAAAPAGSGGASAQDTVAQCIEQVMDVLKQQKER